MTWKIHREVVLLLGWGRAILMQFAHPLVARGVADHSVFRAPSGRLRRLRGTLEAMLTLTFGAPEEAAQVAARIGRVHDRVQGRLPEAAGTFAPGTIYSARDPALMRWVHATLVDSHLVAYELYVAHLTAAERDRYCTEVNALARLLGVRGEELPCGSADFQRYLHEMMTRGHIAVTETARVLAGEVLDPRAWGALQPLMGLLRLLTIGSLPPEIRAAYGFPWDARREAVLRTSARLIRGLLPLTPPALRYWPAARVALERQRHTDALERDGR